ncbi:NUDIX domain-containing protein [Streptomyces sp. NPDC090442]|uniref:NUDIX domain-containing protein n=1 Tax=Streptomyces sp. NPDC090442 TaxID=3365962 RepID=UPI0038150051
MTRNHFTGPPPRRVGALGVLRNSEGAVLFVEKEEPGALRRPYYHPGGCVEGNESVTGALVRLAHARLGIDVEPGRLLAVHHMYEELHAERQELHREGFNLLFDCGVQDIAPGDFVLGANVRGARWVLPSDFDAVLMPFTARRTRAALEALEGGQVQFLAGHPPA